MRRYRTVGQTACPTSDHVDIRREYVRHAVNKPAVQFYSYRRSIQVKLNALKQQSSSLPSRTRPSRSNRFSRQLNPFDSLDTLVRCPSHVGRSNDSLLNILLDSCPFPFLWLPIAASAGSLDLNHVSLLKNKCDLHWHSHFLSPSSRRLVEIDLCPCTKSSAEEPQWPVSSSVRKNRYDDIVG